MKKNKTEILQYINSLKGYQGYVQMSDKPISDIWKTYSNIHINQEEGFVYEAHFCNATESVAIRQTNENWYVSITPLSEIKNKETDIQTYHAINELKVKMAQVWHVENDPLCENMPVLKLKKVVFAGFALSNIIGDKQ